MFYCHLYWRGRKSREGSTGLLPSRAALLLLRRVRWSGKRQDLEPDAEPMSPFPAGPRSVDRQLEWWDAGLGVMSCGLAYQRSRLAPCMYTALVGGLLVSGKIGLLRLGAENERLPEIPMGCRGWAARCAGLLVPDGQLSRKRPANAVTCGVLLTQVVDLHECPFGCFTLVLPDAAGSPRKVPENSHGQEPLFRLCTGHTGALWAGDRGSTVCPE